MYLTTNKIINMKKFNHPVLAILSQSSLNVLTCQ